MRSSPHAGNDPDRVSLAYRGSQPSGHARCGCHGHTARVVLEIAEFESEWVENGRPGEPDLIVNALWPLLDPLRI